jgi:hypothetical protein
LNRILGYILALGTPGVIAALAAVQASLGASFFHTVAGWVTIAAAAVIAIVAALRPVINPLERLVRYSKLYVAYSDIYADLERIVLEISANRTLTQDNWEMFMHVVKRRADCLSLEGDLKPKKRLRRRYTREVNNLIPAKNLWVPQ